MKREILCSTCEIASRKLFPVESPYPGEHVKFVNGDSIVQCRCDDCDRDIKVGEKVCALSIWVDYGGIPYFAWEDEYMDLDAPADSGECLLKNEKV